MDDRPIKFDSCPNCGGTHRVVEEETNKAIARGELKLDAKIPAIVSRSLIFDPKLMPKISGVTKQVPAIFGFYDICVDCGTLYCISIEKGMATIEAKTQAPFGIEPPPFFGRG